MIKLFECIKRIWKKFWIQHVELYSDSSQTLIVGPKWVLSHLHIQIVMLCERVVVSTLFTSSERSVFFTSLIFNLRFFNKHPFKSSEGSRYFWFFCQVLSYSKNSENIFIPFSLNVSLYLSLSSANW